MPGMREFDGLVSGEWRIWREPLMRLWTSNPNVEDKGPPSDREVPPQQQQDDSRSVLKKKLSIFSCGVLLALFVFVSFHNSSIAYFYISWKLSREDALLRVVPRPLAASGLSKLSSPQLSYFGATFETPWGKVSSVKQASSLVRVQFNEGQFVVLFDPTTRVNRLKESRDFALSKGSDISEVYGREAMKSNYAFLHAILYLTPDQISIFSGWKRLVRDGVFLQLKHMEVIGAQTGLYCFQLGTLKASRRATLTVRISSRLKPLTTVTVSIKSGSERRWELKQL